MTLILRGGGDFIYFRWGGDRSFIQNGVKIYSLNITLLYDSRISVTKRSHETKIQTEEMNIQRGDESLHTKQANTEMMTLEI